MNGRSKIDCRSLFPLSLLALAAAFVACGGGDTGGGRLALDDWADQVCALSVDAAATLDARGPEDPSALSLDERKLRAAEVLAPRARALAATAVDLSDLRPPKAAAGFHDTLYTTMADVYGAWLALVDEAVRAETTEQIDAANALFIQAQTVADAEVVAAYEALDEQVKAALSQPASCGILDEIRS